MYVDCACCVLNMTSCSWQCTRMMCTQLLYVSGDWASWPVCVLMHLGAVWPRTSPYGPPPPPLTSSPHMPLHTIQPTPCSPMKHVLYVLEGRSHMHRTRKDGHLRRGSRHAYSVFENPKPLYKRTVRECFQLLGVVRVSVMRRKRLKMQ